MYPASQLARALGKSKRAVLFALASIPPSGHMVVSGNTTAAWALMALPSIMREDLTAMADLRRFHCVEDLLNNAPPVYIPPVLLSEIAQHCLDKATKMQRAMARALSHQYKLPAGQIELIAVEDYQREFG